MYICKYAKQIKLAMVYVKISAEVRIINWFFYNKIQNRFWHSVEKNKNTRKRIKFE